MSVYRRRCSMSPAELSQYSMELLYGEPALNSEATSSESRSGCSLSLKAHRKLSKYNDAHEFPSRATGVCANFRLSVALIHDESCIVFRIWRRMAPGTSPR